MNPIPLSVRVNTGEQHTLTQTIDDFIADAINHLKEHFGALDSDIQKKYAELSYRSNHVTDDGLIFLTYQDKVIALLFETRDIMNFVQCTFLRNLEDECKEVTPSEVDNKLAQIKDYLFQNYKVMGYDFEVKSAKLTDGFNYEVTENKVTYLSYDAIILASFFEIQTALGGVKYSFLINHEDFGRIKPKRSHQENVQQIADYIHEQENNLGVELAQELRADLAKQTSLIYEDVIRWIYLVDKKLGW